MRNKNRIPRIIKKLKFIWQQNPDHRLCQLICNISEGSGQINGGDPFYVEDHLFEEQLDLSIAQLSDISNSQEFKKKFGEPTTKIFSRD